MTLVSEIIHDAFRLSNITATAADPTTAQQTEALRHLNRLVESALGAEVGETLRAFPVGSANRSRPAGYPWYNTTPGGDWFVPLNTRLVLNLDQALDIYLHPAPQDGARFAVNDVAGTLSTYNVTLHGNGQLIESGLTKLLDTDNTNSQWFYRADLGDWVLYSPLALVDTFPFPAEFDDFFIINLAMRLNPSYGAGIDPQSSAMLARATKHMKARYSNIQQTSADPALYRLAKVDPMRDAWGGYDSSWGDDNAQFNRGYPW